MNLLSPYYFPNRYPSKWFQQEEQRFDKLIAKAKSLPLSPRQSLDKNQKIKDNDSKAHNLDNVKKRSSKHHVARSLSQQLQKIAKQRSSHPQRKSQA